MSGEFQNMCAFIAKLDSVALLCMFVLNVIQLIMGLVVSPLTKIPLMLGCPTY